MTLPDSNRNFVSQLLIHATTPLQAIHKVHNLLHLKQNGFT